MRRIALILAGVLMLVGLTACGSSSNNTAGNNDTTSASTVSTAAPTDCPTKNDRAFAKTRFVADVGLIIGTFHHWIWKPYQAGKFQKGAQGRTFALIKAGATALLIAKLADNAVKNAKASPLLCKSIAGPLSAAAAKMHALKDQLKGGNFGELATINSMFATVTSVMAAAGMHVKETSK